MRQRLEKLQARRTDSQITTASMLNEVYKRISESESVRYVIGAMQPIDPEYTKNTYQQGDRVCNQLKTRLSSTCEYKYQGSVTNDTHIKARSDIDILLLTGKFYTLEDPQKPKSPYQGDPIKDLIDLRNEAGNCLSEAFPQVNVDMKSSKCITLSGGSLTREIDVVPSNWFNTNDYANSGNEIYRGVQILDAHKKVRIKNTPFLHNEKIKLKDEKCNGGLRKAARLFKSLKYDTEVIDLSSYDLVSIAYNMEIADLAINKSEELKLLQACINFTIALLNNDALRNSMLVPDGHRKIFGDGHATLNGLHSLAEALLELGQDVLSENSRSFKKLEEARIIYS